MSQAEPSFEKISNIIHRWGQRTILNIAWTRLDSNRRLSEIWSTSRQAIYLPYHMKELNR